MFKLYYLIREFTCKYDCMTQLKISQKSMDKVSMDKVSMKKVLDKDVMYDKCFYKSLGEKLYTIDYD